jgi:hypothetical protein
MISKILYLPLLNKPFPFPGFYFYDNVRVTGKSHPVFPAIKRNLILTFIIL